MSAAGGMAFGAPGAIGMGLLGGAGMIADQVTGAGSLDYAGKYWNEQSGGMFSKAAQWGGNKAMSFGNYFGDRADRQNTLGVDMGTGGPTPGPSTGISELNAPISDASAYAALGMPDQLAGAVAPKKIIPSDIYSEEQMRREGGSGGGKNKNWYGSASNRTGRTLIPEDVLAGDRNDQSLPAVDLNQYIQRMQDTRAANQVGASNNQLQSSIIAQNDHTQPTTPASASPDEREAAQRVESETRRSVSEGGGDALVGAIEALNSKLESLTDIKIDTSEITTAIGVSTTEIVGALGSELSVSVSNSTFDVNVLSLPAGTPTDAASAGGPDVTVLAANLENLLGVQDIQKTQLESHETRISTGEITDTQQNSDIATLQTDTQGLDANTISTQITSEIVTAQTTIQGEVNDAIVVVDGKVVANTALINIARATADEALTVADSLDGQIQTASDTSIDAKNTADATKKVADATKIVADNAALVATAAQSEASSATAAIDKITQTVNANRQSIEAEVRTVKGTVDTNTSVGTENAKAIRKLAGDVVKADNIAQTANARANQR